MPLRTICLPPVHIGLRQGEPKLSLQTTVVLEAPESVSDVRSYSDLVNAERDDQLWVTRHRSSYFSVILTKGSSNLSSLERVMAADWIESHEIWARLGLRVVGSDADYHPANISWSVQHPDLTSVLSAPEQALTAEFREVRCSMELKQSSQVQQVAKGSKRQKVKEEDFRVSQTLTQEAENNIEAHIQEEKYDSLDPEGQRLVDQMLGPRSPKINDDRRTTKKRTQRTTSEHLISLEDFRGLIEGALEIALFGTDKRLNGIKVLNGPNIQGLTHLLPGVFHMPHLKAVSERASFLPVIATSLARMANAESPSLRRKANDFQYGLPQLDIHTNSSERTIQGIEKALWRTLLKHGKIPALKPRNSARTVQQPATPMSTNRDVSREPTLVLGEMFASQASSSSERSALDQWKPSFRLGTPAIEVKREPTLSLGTPTSIPETSGQEMVNRTSMLFPNSLTPAEAPAIPSPLSTPTLQIFGSSNTNTPGSIYFPQTPFGVNPLQTSVVSSHAQRDVPLATSNTQYYPLASQNQNHHPVGLREQHVYSIGSHSLDLGMEASQQNLSQGGPADFASFGEFLGDVSMTDFGFGT